MFTEASAFDALERQLRAHGQAIEELSTGEVEAFVAKAHRDFSALFAVLSVGATGRR